MFKSIEIILATKGRAKTQLPTFINSCHSTALHPEDIKITAVVNVNDYDSKILLESKGAEVIFESLKAPHLASLMNMGYDMSRKKGDIVMYCGDDMEFVTPSWDDIVREDINKSNGFGLVCGDDGYLSKPECPTWFFATRMLIDTACTTFVNPRYGREGTDKVWGAIVGPPLNLVMWDERLRIEHHHASRTGKYDDTFNELCKADLPGYNGGAYWQYVHEAQKKIVKAARKLKVYANETINPNMPRS